MMPMTITFRSFGSFCGKKRYVSLTVHNRCFYLELTYSVSHDHLIYKTIFSKSNVNVVSSCLVTTIYKWKENRISSLECTLFELSYKMATVPKKSMAEK